MSDKPLVIVLSRNNSTGLSVIRSLGHAGYTVDLIASASKEGDSKVVRASKYVRNAVEIVSKKVGDEGDKELVSEILKFRNNEKSKPILFPTDDYTTSIVDSNRTMFEDCFLMPNIKGGEEGDLSRLMDKSVQLKMAEEIGFNVPSTSIISLKDEIITIPQDVIYPVFVKPIMSINGYKTEMTICNNTDELLEHLKVMKERFSNREVIIQEYLKIDKEIETAGVVVNGEVFLPAMIIKTRIGVHGKGVTLTGRFASFDELGVKDKTFELLKRIGYFGCFGLEFNVVGDKVYFNEINLRCAGENYAYYQSNVNLPLIFVEALQGIEHHPNEMEFTGFGKQMIYDKIAWDDYIYGYISKEELDECIATSEISILCGDTSDPKPEKLFIEENLEKKAKKDRISIWRESAVKNAMDVAGWSRAEAEDNIANARKRLGISYNDYRKNNFCLLTDEQQKIKYEQILNRKESRLAGIEEKPLVVVISRIYSTGLSVIRSLGAAGYSVDLIANCHKEGQSEVARASKYIRKSVEIVSSKVSGGGDRAILKELLKYKYEKERPIVLFPTDDYTTFVVDSYRDKLQEIFIMPSIIGGKQGDMVNLMKKTVQNKLALEAGFDVPEEWVVDLRRGVTIPDDISFPVFVKPIESFTGYKVEMKVCRDNNQLIRHLRFLQDRFSEREILIQEYLEIENEIDISGVCINQKVIIPAVIRKTQVARYERGVTLGGVVVPVEELGSVKNKIVKFMQSLKYFGMFDLELNVANGRIYFNEVNLRSGGPNFAYFMCGVNLPALVVQELIGKGHNVAQEKVKNYHKSFIYEKVALDDYAHNMISKRKYRRLLAKADIRLLECCEDPKPTELFYELNEQIAEETRRKTRKEMMMKVLRPYLGGISQIIKGYPQTKKKNRRNPNAKCSRVLVAGRNYCSNLTMAKSLSEGGYEVEVLRIFQKKPGNHNILKTLKPEMYSKHVKAYYVCNSNRSAVFIVERLKSIADKYNKMLIVPSDDLVASIIDDYYDELKEYYVMPSVGGKGGGITRLMNKALQKTIARDAGLPVLNSCLISSNDESSIIPDSINFPCFIKPNISKNSSKSKMKICETYDELKETLDERLSTGFEIMVEDFVEIKREISFLGLSTEEGVVCPGYIETIEGGRGKHRGVALVGRVLPTDEVEPLLSEVIKFVETLNYNGLFDVDLIETIDGKIYFLELNLRYGASGYALTKCGVNLPAMFADYMLKGISIDKGHVVDEAYKIFASEKILMDEYIEGILTLDDIDKINNSVDINFIKDKEDSKPYKHYMKQWKFAKELREYNLEKNRKKTD